MADVMKRRVMRAQAESDYVNTINVADRVTVDFVWYPGEAKPNVDGSLVDTLVVKPAGDGTERIVEYTWTPAGRDPTKRPMQSGRITLSLSPGSTGTLEVFGTSWEITRAAAGESLEAVAKVKGIQQRLNSLGYHLRAPGDVTSGADGVATRSTEMAVLAFQADYRPQAGAAAAAASRLNIRGEWMNNPAIANNLNWYNQLGKGPNNFNPSATDSTAMQAALAAAAGA